MEEINFLKAENARLSRLPAAQPIVSEAPTSSSAPSPTYNSNASSAPFTSSTQSPSVAPATSFATDSFAPPPIQPTLPPITTRRVSSRMQSATQFNSNYLNSNMPQTAAPILDMSSLDSKNDLDLRFDSATSSEGDDSPVATSPHSQQPQQTRPHRLPASIAWFMGFAMCMAFASHSSQDPARMGSRPGNNREKTRFNFPPPPGPDAVPSQWASWAEAAWNTHQAEFLNTDFNTLQNTDFFSSSGGYSDPGFRSNFKGGFTASNFAPIMPNVQHPLNLNDDEEEDEFAYYRGDINFPQSLFSTMPRSPAAAKPPVSTPNLSAQFSRDLTVSGGAGRKRSFSDLASLNGFSQPAESAKPFEMEPVTLPPSSAPIYSTQSNQYAALVSLGNQVASSIDPSMLHDVLQQSGWNSKAGSAIMAAARDLASNYQSSNNLANTLASTFANNFAEDFANNYESNFDSQFPSNYASNYAKVGVHSPSREKDIFLGHEQPNLFSTSAPLPLSNTDPESFIESPVNVEMEESASELRKNSFDDFFVSSALDQDFFKDSSLLFSTQLTPLNKPELSALFDPKNDMLAPPSLGLSTASSYDIQNSPKRQKVESLRSPMTTAFFSTSPSGTFP